MARSKDPNNYTWKGKHKKIRMMEMSATYLQKAHTCVALRELELFNLINSFNELKSQLEEVAELRGIQLQDPDQLNTKHKWGTYFYNSRKNKDLKTPILATTKTE